MYSIMEYIVHANSGRKTYFICLCLFANFFAELCPKPSWPVFKSDRYLLFSINFLVGKLSSNWFHLSSCTVRNGKQNINVTNRGVGKMEMMTVVTQAISVSFHIFLLQKISQTFTNINFCNLIKLDKFFIFSVRK